MIPVICAIGPFTVYAYGFMLAVAVTICAWLFSQEAQRHGIRRERIVDFVFWIVLAGILGARLFFVVTHWTFFAVNPLEILMVQKGGLSWQGGLILGAAAGAAYIKKQRWAFGKTIDMAVPYAALGQSIGRIGCFLNGCCYGKPSIFGIYFPVHQAALHPAQLYDAFGLVCIFVILRAFQKTAGTPGRLFALYLLLTASLRFVVEFYRDDHTLLGYLSLYQWICLGLMAVAAGLMVYLKCQRTP